MEEIDLKEILNMFWGKKIQIIIIVLIFTILGCVYTLKFTIPMYASSITLVLASSNDNAQNTTITTSDINVNSKLISTYNTLIKSKNVLNEVISNLGMDINEKELKNNISVNSVKNTDLIKITVKNENPNIATKIANEIANVFSKKVKELYNINNIYLMGDANVPNAPTNINHKKNIAFFLIIGLGVAIVYVVALNMLDTTIKTPETIEKEYNLPVLASIPKYENKIRKAKRGKR